MVLVGTTGTGKTTCLNIYTGASLPTGDSAQSVTEETVAVEDKLHGPGAPLWVDMPGKTAGWQEKHYKKIPHTGDKASLDRCEYPKTQFF